MREELDSVLEAKFHVPLMPAGLYAKRNLDLREAKLLKSLGLPVNFIQRMREMEKQCRHIEKQCHAIGNLRAFLCLV